MLNAVKNSWRSPGSNRSPHSSESTALSTQPNSHLRMAVKDWPNSCLVWSNQARLRIKSCDVVWLHPSSSTCTLWLVSASQRKKIETDDHLTACATALARLSSTKQSSSGSVDLQWCTFSRVEQISGYVPRENGHHGAHFRGWCTNSRANLCAGARLREGDRIRCYTGAMAVHGALLPCVCVSEQNFFHYATNRNKVGFCRKVRTRHSCNCHGSLALLCPDRVANVQTYRYRTTKKLFRLFSFLSVVSPVYGEYNIKWRMLSKACIRLGKWRLDRSTSTLSSWKVERAAIIAFFLDGRALAILHSCMF